MIKSCERCDSEDDELEAIEPEIAKLPKDELSDVNPEDDEVKGVVLKDAGAAGPWEGFCCWPAWKFGCAPEPECEHTLMMNWGFWMKTFADMISDDKRNG